jgi:sugar phosphate isomerase/epimerase
MKLGAQFYTLRNHAKTPEDLRSTMKRIKEMGYDVMQASAICAIEPELLKSYIDETELPITCTHRPLSETINETEKSIKFHTTIGCPVVGLGSMPEEYRKDLDSLKEFVKALREPIKKLNAAGLKFAYHNHAFEFEDLGGVIAYDVLIEEFENLTFILDTYWVKYGGYDYLDYIKSLGNKRIQNVHFKDMKTEPKGEICPCGVGVIDFAPVVKLCNELSIPNALVEQDNAPALGDSFEQMGISYANLAHLFK